MIRVVTIDFVSNGQSCKIPAYVSLVSDRSDGGGYRSTPEVMSDGELLGSLHQTAVSELRAWMGRFEFLDPKLVRVVQKATGIPIHPPKKRRLQEAA